MNDMFIGDVVVVAHNRNGLDVIVPKPMILFTSHAVVHQILIHGRADRITISQIEREKTLLVVELRELDTVRILSMEILGRFALNKRGLRLFLENRVLG